MRSAKRKANGLAISVALISTILVLGLIAESADARGRGGRGGGASVHQRFGANSAGRAMQSSATRSRSNQRFSSGGFSSTGQMHQSRGSYQGNRPTRGTSNSGSRSSYGTGQARSANQGQRTDSRGQRSDNRSQQQSNRADTRGDRTEGRQENRGDRQGEVTDRQDSRQEGRTDRTDTRQNEMSDRSESRQDSYDDYWDDYHDHHNDYWHGDDEWWALAAGLTIGAAIATLPPRYETVYVSNTTYYYANGSYYTTAPAGGYVMAAPPTGAVVEQPPAQVVNVTVNDQDYGYSNGAYYEVQEPEEEGGDPTFKTVEAPVGAKVDYVPDGAESKTVDGIVYFVFNDTYYRPFYSGSDVVYMVVENPEGAA